MIDEDAFINNHAAEQNIHRDAQKEIDADAFLDNHAAEQKRHRAKQKERDEDALHRDEAARKKRHWDNRKERDGVDAVHEIWREQWQQRKERMGETQLTRRQHFFDTVRDGLIYSCVCCKRRKFRKSVYVYDGDDLGIAQDLIEGAIGELNPRQQVRGQYFICHDCKNKLCKGKNAKMPALCHKNNLGLVDLEGKDELILTPLENALIARLLIFQYIVKLPKSQWAATKNKIVVVPIEEQDVSDTLKSLPRTPDEAGIIPVQLKRKVEYKNSHREE